MREDSHVDPPSVAPGWLLWLPVVLLLAILALECYFVRASCSTLTDVDDGLFRAWLAGTPILLVLTLVVGVRTLSRLRSWLALGALWIAVAVLYPVAWYEFFACSE